MAIRENDPETKSIVYFGELGGYDEYELADLIEQKKVTKPIVAYIAGSISEMFPEPPQFGHAKAMASRGEETARAKREALIKAGEVAGLPVKVAQTYEEFVQFVKEIQTPEIDRQSENEKKLALEGQLAKLHKRKPGLFTSTISGEKDGEVQILNSPLLQFAQENSFARIFASMLLGKNDISEELERFTELVIKMLVDHGPYQSGAINTMVTARAGKDLVSGLVSGLLTIGPRFGGAINDAAGAWLNGLERGVDAYTFVEEYAAKKIYIPGIGHKKYTVDNPDPRVSALQSLTVNLDKKSHIQFAQEVAKVTSSKKSNLILNVDGIIAATLLDILSEKEGLSEANLRQLVEIEFFNAFFVLPRTVGFTAHYLDQRRLDEGLFRLSASDVTSV